MKFVDEQIPKQNLQEVLNATPGYIYAEFPSGDYIEDDGFGIAIASNDFILFNSDFVFKFKKDENQITIYSNKTDFKGIVGNAYFGQNYEDFSFVQKKYVDDLIDLLATKQDLERFKPYQVVVASGGFDVSQVENDDITVIFSDTTDEVATLTIPTADASNEGVVINFISYSRGKNLSEDIIDTNGDVYSGDIYAKKIKIKSINNSWYEIH